MEGEVDELNDSPDDLKVPGPSLSFRQHRSSFIASGRRPSGAGRSAKRKHETEEVPSFLSTGPRHLGVEELATLLTNAVSCYYHDRGIHCSAGESWVRFFGDTDVDGSGRITFDELETAIRKRLRTGISRYQLLVLWRQLDSDGSGEVSVEEVVQFLYRVDLSSWPEGSNEDVKRAVKRLHKAGAMWHQAAGNWYKIFLQIDHNQRGYITLDDLKRAVRGGFYGFRLTTQDLPEEDLHKMWKALDDEAEMRVPLRKFLAFMRRMGGGPRRRIRVKRRNTLKAAQSFDLSSLPQLEDEELLLGAQQLVLKMAKYHGLHSTPTSLATPEVWTHLFHTIHPEGSFRIRYPDFEDFARKLEVSPKMLNRIRALWRLIDADASGEASEKEFVLSLYRLQLARWPTLEEKDLERAMAVLNAAADRWHRAGGNWFKVLSICDEDGSGRLDYEELQKVVRKAYPGLKISESVLKDEELRGVWKAMDTDQSGHVSIQEFMVFARRYGTRSPPETKVQKAQETSRELSEEDQLYVIRTLEASLKCYFSRSGLHGRDSWENFFQHCGADRYGRINLEKLIAGMRQKLLTLPGIESEDESDPSAVVRGVSLEEFRAIWRLFEDKGSVSAKAWALGLYRTELNSWPTVVETQVRSTVRSLKLRADRIHQSPDNWYRVFCVATDNSPTMTFDELKFIVRLHKTPGLSLSPRELPTDRLRMLWREMDTARTGLVSRGSFIAFMRRFAAPKAKPPAKDRNAQVREARKLLADGLANVGVESLRDALESWGAEWTGYVSEWDWQHIARQLLEYTEEQLSDDALHGVWTELDHKNEGELEAEQLLERLSMQSRLQKVSGSTTLTDLLRPGTESTHPPSTAASALLSTPGRTPGVGLTGVTAPPGDAVGRGIETPTGEQPEAPDASLSLSRLGTQTAQLMSKPHGVFTLEQDPALRLVAERLAEALMAYLHKRGVHCSTTIAGWHRFFSEMDADDSGRATFEEMEDAFQRCLSHARVSRYELLMLWRRLDADGSGEVSLDEFVKMMYRYELAMWPRSSDQELSRVVKVVSHAISRWHHVEGNWYKVFLFIDTQGTGTITFEDLQKFLRGTYPGLHLDREELPSDDMFRLWKALDTTARMRVPKSEFMSFMRRYGGTTGKSEKTAKDSLLRDGSDSRQTPRKVQQEESGHARTQSFMAAMRRNQRERQTKAFARRQRTSSPEAEEEVAQRIMDHLSHYTVEQLMSAYNSWGLPWIGVVSEWEWQLVVRRLLGFDEDRLDDTVLHSLWTCIDQQLTGYVAAGDLLQMMRIGRRQVKGSPRQDLCSFHPNPDAASDRLHKQEKIFTEATYWRSAWWTTHLRHTQGLLPKVGS